MVRRFGLSIAPRFLWECLTSGRPGWRRAKPEGTCCRSCDLVICNEAPGSGSKPSRQWRGSTPITSVVPDSVRKAVVTVGVKPG
jgi:hypothetical protein